MLNPIKSIFQFNQKAGLLDTDYDDFLESSFQIEETLEGFGHLEDLATILNVDATDKLPKHISRAIVKLAQRGNHRGADNQYIWTDIPSMERLDKACDAIVYAFGSIFKLGLNPAQATRAINAVMKANNAKLHMPKDEHGKLMKPAGFVGPEPELQAILDEK